LVYVECRHDAAFKRRVEITDGPGFGLGESGWSPNGRTEGRKEGRKEGNLEEGGKEGRKEGEARGRKGMKE
jgi:hypothetical protein